MAADAGNRAVVVGADAGQNPGGIGLEALTEAAECRRIVLYQRAGRKVALRRFSGAGISPRN